MSQPQDSGPSQTSAAPDPGMYDRYHVHRLGHAKTADEVTRDTRRKVNANPAERADTRGDPGALSSYINQGLGEQAGALSTGALVRDAPGPPRPVYQAISHADLYNSVNIGAEPGAVGSAADSWVQIGNTFSDLQQNIMSAVGASETDWTGNSAAKARSSVAKLSNTAGDAGQSAQLAGTLIAQQSEAIATARATVPPPPNPMVTPDSVQAQLDATTDPVAHDRINSQAQAAFAAQDSAHIAAADAVQRYDTLITQTSAAQPAFAPAPTVTAPGPGGPNGSTGHGGGTGPVGGTNPVVPPSGGGMRNGGIGGPGGGSTNSGATGGGRTGAGDPGTGGAGGGGASGVPGRTVGGITAPTGAAGPTGTGGSGGVGAGLDGASPDGAGPGARGAGGTGLGGVPGLGGTGGVGSERGGAAGRGLGGARSGVGEPTGRAGNAGQRPGAGRSGIGAAGDEGGTGSRYGGGSRSGPGTGEGGRYGSGAGEQERTGRSFGAGGEEEMRGSAGRSGGFGSAAAQEESAAGRAGAGRGGQGGLGAGGRGGRGGADEEHRSPSYLVEPDPDELFGSTQRVAPPVIG